MSPSRLTTTLLIFMVWGSSAICDNALAEEGNTTPTISAIEPTSGEIGTNVTIHGSGFNKDSVVHIEGTNSQGKQDGYALRLYSGGPVENSDGTSISFTFPKYLSSCSSDDRFFGSFKKIDPSKGRFDCAGFILTILPGTYPIYVSNELNVSNKAPFNVTGPAPTPKFLVDIRPTFDAAPGQYSMFVNGSDPMSLGQSPCSKSPGAYTLDFGDGETQVLNLDDKCGMPISHIYTSPDIHTVKILSGNNVITSEKVGGDVALGDPWTVLILGHPGHITWSVTNAVSCQVTGTNGDAWNGVMGAYQTRPLTSTTVYTLSCNRLDGSALKQTATVKDILKGF